MKRHTLEIHHDKPDYSGQKVTILTLVIAMVLFFVLNSLDILRGDKTAIAFWFERIFVLASIYVYYFKLRACEKKREVLADSAILIISMTWISMEGMSRLLELYYFGQPSALSERLVLVIILIGSSVLSFRSRKFVLFFVTYLFVCFLALEILTFSPPLFLGTLLISYVYALFFALKKYNNLRIFEVTVKSYFNSLWKVRKAEEEIIEIRDKCLHLGNVADAMNSPILVVQNCIATLKKEATTINNLELIEKIASIEQRMIQVQEFSTWLSHQRDSNASLKQSGKILFEMTKLLKEGKYP